MKAATLQTSSGKADTEIWKAPCKISQNLEVFENHFVN